MSQNRSKLVSSISVIAIIILMALFVTLPAFVHIQMKIGTDGVIHADRIEQVFQSLRHGTLPARVSFFGMHGKLTAMASMYPWLTTIIMAVPRFLVTPVQAWFIGYFFINLITGALAYQLAGEFTSNRLYKLLGSAIYVFSGYHMILLYARTALGEALAYAFYPLIVYGCVRIWKTRRWSWLYLGLGMALVANSHILSLLFAAVFLGIIEVWRMFRKQFKLQELSQFFYAGILALVGSLYALYSIIILQIDNHIFNPFTLILPLDAKDVFNNLISNKFYEGATGWGLGLGITVLIGYMILFGLGKYNSISQTKWQKWTLTALGSQLVLLSWLPWSALKSTPVSLIQFLGRFLGLSSVLTLIAVVLFVSFEKKSKFFVVIASSLVGLLCFSSVYTYERDPSTNTSTSVHYELNSANYGQLLNKMDNPDYEPYTLSHGNKVSTIKSSNGIKVKVVSAKYNSITYKITSKSAGVKNIPVSYYKGVNYDIKVNHVSVDSLNQQSLALNLENGVNTVQVTSNPQMLDYLMFAISVIGILGAVCGMVVDGIRDHKGNK